MTMDCTTCGSPHTAHLAPGHRCSDYRPAIGQLAEDRRFRLEHALNELYERHRQGARLTDGDVEVLRGIGQALFALAASTTAADALDGTADDDDDGMGDICPRGARR